MTLLKRRQNKERLHCKSDDQKKLDHWPIPNFEKDDGSKNSN